MFSKTCDPYLKSTSVGSLNALLSFSQVLFYLFQKITEIQLNVIKAFSEGKIKGLRITPNAGFYPRIQSVVLKLLLFEAGSEMVRSVIYQKN